jgi:Domain of unknown function (DUF6436)
MVFIWLAGTGVGFWFIELRDFRTVDTSAIERFDSGRRNQLEDWYRDAGLGGSAKLTFVHVYPTNCRCNASTEEHLARLLRKYQPQAVRFVAAGLPSTRRAAPPPLGLPAAGLDGRLPVGAGVVVGPAALIFNQVGKLVYYGPYSDSGWCGGGGALVDRVIDRALDGVSPRMGSTVRGCFCPETN